MRAYDRFAQVYDLLMNDVNYDDWIWFMKEIFKRSKINIKNILDLACGTGNITNRLASEGYNITGIDISEQMLTIAKKKAHDKGLIVDYLNQDITELDFPHSVDGVLCLCDGINYITDSKKLLDTFKRIYSTIRENGIFIFDISSYYKLSHILGNNIFAENLDDVSYIWENYFDPKDDICELDLTFFIRNGHMFERFNEVHHQKAYKEGDIIQLLKNANFTDVNVFNNYLFKETKKTDERKVFICYK